MSATIDRLDAIQQELEELRAQHEAQPESPSLDPEVRAAGEALARAVGASLGVNQPMQVAEGSELPVIELPREFVENGGVGVAVIVARPPSE